MMNAQNHRTTDSHSHNLTGGSDARIIMDVEEPALQRLWREKRDEAETEGLSGEPRPSQPCDHARAKLSTGPVRAAHAEFVAAMAGHPPRPIPLEADALDLEDRADHLNTVLSALSVYVAVVQNVPGRLDLRDAEGVLADLASDLTGAIQQAADDMAGRVA
jgi:hypothetical protein